MALVGLTQCAARWHSVLASYDKQYGILIANNSDATKERDLVRRALVNVRQLIQKPGQKNGTDATWQRKIERKTKKRTL
jgi:hypothetical protein